MRTGSKLFTLFASFFLMASSLLYGQNTIQGKVINSRTKEVIQYANIGIPGVNIGTISNPDGSFAFVVPAKWLKDSVTFSSIGYYTRSVAIPFLLLQ